ncbi:MAG: glycosyltransferase family 39 protein [Candidatus Omnitrophica bacterium]|nr:glycosyltransferase family 39 protein [Candidatus Omnitrophota bacterium]
MINKNKIRVRNFILFFLVALGASLRFYQLSFFDLWYDEVYSVIGANNLAYFLRIFAYRYQPPLYYMILHLWINLFGDGEFVIRSLSSFFGSASIPFVFIIGKKFYNNYVGLISALIFTICPLHIWYAQEARMYSLSVFFSLVMVFMFLKSVDLKRGFAWWFLIAVVSIINIYLNYFTVLLLLPIIIFIAGRKKISFSRLIFLLSLIILFLLPFTFFFYKQFSLIRRMFWLDSPQFYAIPISLGNFLLGYNASFGQFSAAIILISLAIIIWLFMFNSKGKDSLLLSYSILPLILLFFAGKYLAPVYLSRYLIIFSPFFYILISSLIMKTKCKKIFCLFLSFLIILMSFSLFNYYQGKIVAPLRFHHGVPAKKSFDKAIDIIKDNILPGDLIAHSHVSTIPSFLYYFKDSPLNQIYLTIPEEQKDEYWRRRYSLDKIIAINKGYLNEGQYGYSCYIFGKEKKYYNFRMWLISSNWLRNGILGEHATAVRKRAMRRFKKIRSFYRDGIYVDLYDLKKAD